MDVYLFYGNSKKNSLSRWCIGFDYPNAEDLIKELNIQEPFVAADHNPQNWVTKDGQSYSIILPFGVSETEQSNEWSQLVNRYLQVIEKVTYTKPNLIQL